MTLKNVHDVLNKLSWIGAKITDDEIKEALGDFISKDNGLLLEEISNLKEQIKKSASDEISNRVMSSFYDPCLGDYNDSEAGVASNACGKRTVTLEAIEKFLRKI